MRSDGIGPLSRTPRDMQGLWTAGPHPIEIGDARFHAGLVNGSVIAVLLWLGLFLTIRG